MTQPTLFDEPPTRQDREDAASAGRDQGLADAEAHADRQWKADAWAWLTDYLREHDEFFPDDACREGPQPREKRAWGPIILRASRAGMIVRAGFRSRTSGHMTAATVWRSVCYTVEG